MATERQIAANRKNAARSGGPRSQAGKRRSSRNSYQHGLSRPATLGSADQDWIERFAQAATKEHRTLVTLELGRSAAVAHLDILRVRLSRAACLKQLNAALQEWPSISLRNEMHELDPSVHGSLPRLQRVERTRGRRKRRDREFSVNPPAAEEPVTHPGEAKLCGPCHEHRSARSKTDQRNNIRLALRRLNRLDRYEQRAAWARNKALRQIWAAAARTDSS